MKREKENAYADANSSQATKSGYQPQSIWQPGSGANGLSLIGGAAQLSSKAPQSSLPPLKYGVSKFSSWANPDILGD